ncbi:16S rRNA (guanine(527)-N(7))-methyltransferase RsmG [Ruminococcus sp. FC2018]|uniref:16S rRNA (guanine(527)-N(7))-methyltransferase RsmG n=1 Tax=Ruminococcus sp. FC2018 TaxID=1410617 RepID=UPI00056ACDDB|nr:16S rRNA (guanine(527)-N(7))-methyltransferase RsmG [Ruminococcus sp. FC2018]
MQIFTGAGIAVTDEQFEKYDRYAQMLCAWNENINLTAITDPEGIAIKHFFDSVFPFFTVGIPRDSTLIDIGTGAGFPGCAVKIWRDDIKLTLLDSLQKRITFLAQLSDSLGLGATCLHARAEELGRNGEFRERFDFATARAVANLSDLCEYCLPFVKQGGSFIALKGSDAKQEIDSAAGAIELLGGKLSLVKEYTLPNGDGRTLVVIDKVKATDEKYPRTGAQMKKKRL